MIIFYMMWVWSAFGVHNILDNIRFIYFSRTLFLSWYTNNYSLFLFEISWTEMDGGEGWKRLRLKRLSDSDAFFYLLFPALLHTFRSFQRYDVLIIILIHFVFRLIDIWNALFKYARILKYQIQLISDTAYIQFRACYFSSQSDKSFIGEKMKRQIVAKQVCCVLGWYNRTNVFWFMAPPIIDKFFWLGFKIIFVWCEYDGTSI